MQFESDGYVFKPHEMPLIDGSPASPEHSGRRRAAYLLIGVLLALTAGLQNGLAVAGQVQFRGALGLDLLQDGWVQVAYYMSYACMSILLFKVRKHFGVRRFVRWLMSAMLFGAVLQWFSDGFVLEVAVRVTAGVVASGLMVTSIFYFMQGFSGAKKLGGVMLGLGLMLCAVPLAQVLVPLLFGEGNIRAVYGFYAAMALLSVGCMLGLPLPPGRKVPALGWLDGLSFMLFAGGIALLCAFLVLGRVVWWSTPWLGYLLAGGVALSGTALLVESRRRHPMLDVSWMSMPRMLGFGLTAALVRVLTSEQTVGAAGLMSVLGMSGLQMRGFYIVVLVMSVLGVAVSLIRLDLDDIRRPVVVSLLGLALGAWLDTNVGMDTRPVQLYASQALIAFSALYFLGPMLMEGLARALAKSPDHIMSFSAVFGLSQSVGGLLGAALFNAFVVVRTRVHLGDIGVHLTQTNPNLAAEVRRLAYGYAPYGSDPALLQTKAASDLAAQAAKNATVLAFNDLFGLIAVCAFAAFLCSAVVWWYRRCKKIDLLAHEKERLAALLKP